MPPAAVALGGRDDHLVPDGRERLRDDRLAMPVADHAKKSVDDKAILASVVFRRAATSALVCIAAWLVFTVFSSLFAGLLANALANVFDDATFDEQLRHARTELTISRFSPETLYEEASTAVLLPEVRSLGILTQGDVERAVTGELSLTQSLLVAWPQITALVALIVVLFMVAYLLFMRQEIRA